MMTSLHLETGLRMAGVLLSGLALANFAAAKRWGYRENLAGCSAMVRQVFYVHCAYIVAILIALAVLCLSRPEWLLEGRMGQALCGFFGAFWASRVIVQLCYYDRETRRRSRGWDLFFLGVFLSLSAIFTLTAMCR